MCELKRLKIYVYAGKRTNWNNYFESDSTMYHNILDIIILLQDIWPQEII